MNQNKQEFVRNMSLVNKNINSRLITQLHVIYSTNHILLFRFLAQFYRAQRETDESRGLMVTQLQLKVESGVQDLSAPGATIWDAILFDKINKMFRCRCLLPLNSIKNYRRFKSKLV